MASAFRPLRITSMSRLRSSDSRSEDSYPRFNLQGDMDALSLADFPYSNRCLWEYIERSFYIPYYPSKR